MIISLDLHYCHYLQNDRSIVFSYADDLENKFPHPGQLTLQYKFIDYENKFIVMEIMNDMRNIHFKSGGGEELNKESRDIKKIREYFLIS